MVIIVILPIYLLINERRETMTAKQFENKWFKSLIILMVLTLIISSFPFATSAQSKKEEQETLDLAEDLEYLME